MSWITRSLKQTITRWTPSGAPDMYGNTSWTISYVKGRWEDTQIKTVDTNGVDFISNAVVYLASDVITGDFLALGTFSTPTPYSTAREVKNVSKIPSIRGNVIERKAVMK